MIHLQSCFEVRRRIVVLFADNIRSLVLVIAVALLDVRAFRLRELDCLLFDWH